MILYKNTIDNICLYGDHESTVNIDFSCNGFDRMDVVIILIFL